MKEIRELEAQQSASRQRLDDLFQSMLHGAFNLNIVYWVMTLFSGDGVA